MIFYFSATGNSQWVASLLSERLQLPMYDFTDGQVTAEFIQERTPAGCTVFVVPVHGWEVPRLMANFLRFLQEKGFHSNYIYVVFTCGDDCGLAHKKIEKLISPLSDHPLIAYSVQMPNTYIPMFELDDNETARAKVTDTQNRISQIANDILSKKTIWQVKEGAWPRLKTYVVNPLFVHFCIRTKPFHTDEGCISCGLCVSACPLGNIRLQNGHPQWGTECVHCMACLHACPRSVIQYGHSTQKRGRYSLKDFL